MEYVGAATPRQKKLAPLPFRPAGKSSAMLLPFSSPPQTHFVGLCGGNLLITESKKRDTRKSVSFFGAATQIYPCGAQANCGPLFIKLRMRSPLRIYVQTRKNQHSRMGILVFWSCYPDSNWGPHPYQGCALPAEL